MARGAVAGFSLWSAAASSHDDARCERDIDVRLL
jgi:hypothetical protein